MTRQELRKRYATAIHRILDGPNGNAYHGVLPDAVLSVRDDELTETRDELARACAHLLDLERRYAAACRLHGLDQTGGSSVCKTCRLPYPCPTVQTLDEPTQE